MTRKIFSLVLLAGLSLSFLAACSSTGSSKPYSVIGDSSNTGWVADSKGHPRPASTYGK